MRLFRWAAFTRTKIMDDVPSTTLWKMWKLGDALYVDLSSVKNLGGFSQSACHQITSEFLDRSRRWNREIRSFSEGKHGSLFHQTIKNKVS